MKIINRLIELIKNDPLSKTKYGWAKFILFILFVIFMGFFIFSLSSACKKETGTSCGRYIRYIH